MVVLAPFFICLDWQRASNTVQSGLAGFKAAPERFLRRDLTRRPTNRDLLQCLIPLAGTGWLMFVPSANNHASCVDNRVEIRVAPARRPPWAGRGLATGLGPDPGHSLLGVAHQGWAAAASAGASAGCGLHRCGGPGGWMGAVVNTATAEGPGQLAVEDAGAVALQGAELVAGCPGAADLVAGDCGLVSGARLEPTYDAGIDCDGWHLWLPA